MGNVFTHFVDNYLVWLGALAIGILMIRNFQGLASGVGTLTGGASTFINTVAGSR